MGEKKKKRLLAGENSAVALLTIMCIRSNLSEELSSMTIVMDEDSVLRRAH